MKPLYFFILTLMLTFTSCSKDEVNIEEPTVPDNEKPGQDTSDHGNKDSGSDSVILKLSANKSNPNVFDDVQFTLINGKNAADGLCMVDINAAYDSITWSDSVEEGHFLVANCKETEEYSHAFCHFSWNHNFIYPGHHETWLKCYKNGVVMHCDTLKIEVTNNKDFIMFNWNDVNSRDQEPKGYNDAFNEKQAITTSSSNKDGTTVIELGLFNATEDGAVFAKKSEVFLTKFISTYFKDPAYTKSEPNTLEEQYNQLFKVKPQSASPLAIWLTEKNKIALLKFEDEDHLYVDVHVEQLER